MSGAYCPPVAPQRLASPETRDVILDWQFHDEILEVFETLAPTITVWPRELDPCSGCPEADGVNDAEAEIVYTRHGSVWTYHIPTCRGCAGTQIKEYRRLSGGVDLHVEIPVPVASGAVA